MKQEEQYHSHKVIKNEKSGEQITPQEAAWNDIKLANEQAKEEKRLTEEWKLTEEQQHKVDNWIPDTGQYNSPPNWTPEMVDKFNKMIVEDNRKELDKYIAAIDPFRTDANSSVADVHVYKNADDIVAHYTSVSTGAQQYNSLEEILEAVKGIWENYRSDSIEKVVTTIQNTIAAGKYIQKGEL